ncbi:MAG: ADP-ribosylglycohydrolase family protein [Lachnospiraceae bacterium]|nr:ADP-ribosylglycohydrolase family protein [Lachnospiraceae bacterium]
MENILEHVRLAYISRKNYLETELRQSREEGKPVDEYESLVKEIVNLSDPVEGEKRALELYEKFRAMPVRPDFPYVEPETEEEILACFPLNKKRKAENLRERLLGAWTARAAGCLLGQPVEGWTRERIVGFLKDTNNYPVGQYMSSDVPQEIKERYNVSDYPGAYGNEKKSWINNVSCMPEDDDTNYTVMGLSIVEKYGRDFVPMDVAEFFTTNIPVFMACTAERMAYKNIVNGILPPRSADYGNPYREWLGGQIRVDGYAYINPGDPHAAASMAVRDAVVTHTKNGIYASAFCAALISESAVCDSPKDAIMHAMDYIPKQSRLHAALTGFLVKWNETKDVQQMIEEIHKQYDETNLHDWCHVIPNDMIICLALLAGGKDFDRVMNVAIEAGFDTDCNGATAGSAFGMMYGIEAVPEKWKKPLNGKLITRIGSGGIVSFKELTDRCIRQII